MKTHRIALAALLVVSTACAHRQPRSSAQIIMEGDRNPTIHADPQRAGEHVREASQPR